MVECAAVVERDGSGDEFIIGELGEDVGGNLGDVLQDGGGEGGGWIVRRGGNGIGLNFGLGIGSVVGGFVFGGDVVIFIMFIIFEFDLIVEVAGIGRVEDGDGAAAFFVGGFGFVERVDESAEGIEAGGGEFGGVGGHGWLQC